MSEFIAWCGFLGAWLLVNGPLNQAIREVEEEEFERDALARAEREVEVPARVSGWWLVVPPVYVVLRRRRGRLYKRRIREAMSPDALRAFAHLRDVASAWLLVAAGASLIAVKETWELAEAYEWGEGTFWGLLIGMVALSAAVIGMRVRRSGY